MYRVHTRYVIHTWTLNPTRIYRASVLFGYHLSCSRAHHLYIYHGFVYCVNKSSSSSSRRFHLYICTQPTTRLKFDEERGVIFGARVQGFPCVRSSGSIGIVIAIQTATSRLLWGSYSGLGSARPDHPSVLFTVQHACERPVKRPW